METTYFQDVTLICIQCGQEWIFTAGNQRFFADKGLTIPKRCPTCRAHRKATIDRTERTSDAGD